MRKYIKKMFWGTLFLCVALLEINCSSERKDYDEARSKNTISAYENFLKQHPKSTYENEIRSIIDTIHFKKTKGINTINAYTNFLNQYPESQLKDSVNFLIEKIYYKQCQNSDSLNSYIIFLKMYPHNNFTNDVKKLLEKKGSIITLPKKKLISLSKISLTPKDHCWLEYRGLLDSGVGDNQSKNRFTLWYKRDRVDSKAIKVATINGENEQILGGTWEYKYYNKGQQLGFTLYDEYGRPKKTTRMPTETAIIKVKFVCINSNDSAAEILLLSESKIVTKIK